MRPPVEDSATTMVSPRSFRRRAIFSPRAINSCIAFFSCVHRDRPLRELARTNAPRRSATSPPPPRRAYEARKRAGASPPADKSTTVRRDGEKARSEETQHDQAAIQRYSLRGEGSGRLGDHQPPARAQRVSRADAP